MSTLHSLREQGTLDENGAQMLYSAVIAAARSRSFPPPAGHTSWDRAATQEVAHDFLTGTNALKRLMKLALLADDDESLQRLLNQTVLNYLRSESRKSTVGRQVRRIRDIAQSDSKFIIIGSEPASIGLSDLGGSPYAGTDDALLRAAARVSVRQLRWRPESDREPPVASRVDLIDLMDALIRAAGGPIQLNQIGRVFSRRFNLARLPDVELDDVLDPMSGRSGAELELAEDAYQILEQLTERERKILPLLDMSSRAVAAEMGLSHSTVAIVQSRLRGILSRAIPNDEDGAAIVRVLTEHLARQTDRE